MNATLRYFVMTLCGSCLAAGCGHSDRDRIQTTGSVRPTAQATAEPAAAAEPAPAVTPANAPAKRGTAPREERSQRTLLASTRDEQIYPQGKDYNISYEDLRDHVENGTALVVDARSPDQFARGHVRNAINIPAGDKEKFADRYLRNVDRGQFIIIYCSSGSCHASDYLYEYLQTLGFANMRVFSPGWLTLAHARSLQ